MDPRAVAGGRGEASPERESPAGEGRSSHYVPRTREGRIALTLFVVLMALAQPPVVHGLADRTDPWILGLPFLYVYLLVVYSALICVLLWGMRKGL